MLERKVEKNLRILILPYFSHLLRTYCLNMVISRRKKKNPGNLAVMVHFLFPQRMNPLYGFFFLSDLHWLRKKLRTCHQIWLMACAGLMSEGTNFHIRWMTNLSLVEYNRLRWRCAISSCIKAPSESSSMKKKWFLRGILEAKRAKKKGSEPIPCTSFCPPKFSELQYEEWQTMKGALPSSVPLRNVVNRSPIDYSDDEFYQGLFQKSFSVSIRSHPKVHSPQSMHLRSEIYHTKCGPGDGYVSRPQWTSAPTSAPSRMDDIVIRKQFSVGLQFPS